MELSLLAMALTAMGSITAAVPMHASVLYPMKSRKAL